MDLITELKNNCNTNIHITYDVFKNCFMKQVNIHAPLKQKTVRANNAPFMNKVLSKSIMIRSQLKNKYKKIQQQKTIMHLRSKETTV